MSLSCIVFHVSTFVVNKHLNYGPQSGAPLLIAVVHYQGGRE